MDETKQERSHHQLWAEFRFGVVRGLLSAPADGILCPLYPVDLGRNADGRRREIVTSAPQDPPPVQPVYEEPPLLQKLIAEYSASGLPPAYIPMLPGEEQ